MVITRSAASAARIKYVMDIKPDLDVIDLPVKSDEYHIEFNDVSFSYNKNLNNIENLSFKLKRGEKLGIIGSTGSGKTTIINLLMRFYDVDQGEVLINGKNIKSYQNEELKKMFGVVFQNDTVFNDSVYENISFGRDIPLDDVIKASEYACAKEFIDKLEFKYDTILSPKGTNISGGQKQRLLIARSLAGNPDILILDDATSALDYKTDSIVRKAINENFANTTTLIVTQRISSIKFCDHILVIEDGDTIGYGTHDELMNSCSVYKEIYISQMGGDIDE